MKTLFSIAMLSLLACASEPERGRPPSPASSSSHSSSSTGGAGGAGGEGGMGGQGGSLIGGGGRGECNPLRDEGCCIVDSACGPGSAGECLIKEELCGGVCVGKPNPAVNVPCGNGGTCLPGKGVCEEPSQGGAGGTGGV